MFRTSISSWIVKTVLYSSNMVIPSFPHLFTVMSFQMFMTKIHTPFVKKEDNLIVNNLMKEEITMIDT